MLQIIGVVLGVILVYLIVIIFFPVLHVKKQEVIKNLVDETIPQNREDVSFDVDGMKVSAWFYKVENRESAACIVMSHGFGGTKDMVLEQYAKKFNSNGFHVLVYDYRYFGESEGEPRQLFCDVYQVEDLKQAVVYVRSRDDVLSDKVFLWGTSNGARYGIIAASFDSDIAGVIAQCGAYDHKEDSKHGIKQVGMGHFFKLFVHAQRDKGRSRFGLSPHCYPMYGRPGTLGMINNHGSFDGVQRLAENSKTFINETPARIAFMPHTVDTLEVAPNVTCPVLIQVCSNDNIVSPVSHVKLVDILGDKVTLKEYPIEHFDIYLGKDFDVATDDQLVFLNQVK